LKKKGEKNRVDVSESLRRNISRCGAWRGEGVEFSWCLKTGKIALFLPLAKGENVGLKRNSGCLGLSD